MPELQHFTHVAFTRFKAFKRFSLSLRHFNILVGPNNAGKSTILAAFRILATGMRKAFTRKAEVVPGPDGDTFGYAVDMRTISVAEENIFYNYDQSHAASASFTLSNGNTLLLHFPPGGSCYLITRATQDIQTPSQFRAHFNSPIGFVPVLGPVEHNEQLYDKEAARLALSNYRAARHFRNIWYHYPDTFNDFRDALKRTWPGMDIEKPFIDYSDDKPRLYMFCPEDRIPREIVWAGFGFQVWCQMLTHLIQSADKSMFLIDEPDIYLHSDLQRQLLGLLRTLGPDIIIATHSTEIINEAESDDILLVSKAHQRAKRIRNTAELDGVFALLGSNLNPVLTQVAKTRKVVFVEGHDFQILRRFAQKLGNVSVSRRSAFAFVPAKGFSAHRIKKLKAGIDKTLGGRSIAAAILNRDYRSGSEREQLIKEFGAFCDYATVLSRKEIDNFVLVPSAIDRAAERKMADVARRTGRTLVYTTSACDFLSKWSEGKKDYVMAQQVAARHRFEISIGSSANEAAIEEAARTEFEIAWSDVGSRIGLIPGKEALRELNKHLHVQFGISLTPTAIIDSMLIEEIPAEMCSVIDAVVAMSDGVSA